MKHNKRIIVSIVWIITGIVLVSLSFMGKVDSFWNGMGSGLLIIGAAQLLRFYRFSKNPVYREKTEIEQNDERIRFISSKAWAWSGYLFILIAAVCCIIFKIIGEDLLSLAASTAVCLMMVLYWIVYLILKKKY